MLHLQRRLGGAKQKDQAGCKDRGQRTGDAGHHDQRRHRQNKQGPSNKTRMDEHLDILVVKIVAEISLA